MEQSARTAALRRNIVLIGANSDIGSVLLARASRSLDRQILAVSRKPPQLGSTTPANVLRLSGIDLVEEKHLRRLAAVVRQMFSEPFAVIHSVGNFWRHKALIDTSFDEMANMLKSQVLTLLGVARFLTPVMHRNGGGMLVTFSCNSVSYNYPDMSPFTASKAAIESFVKCYANEHSEFGISACALALPTIRTPKVLKEKPRGDDRNYIKPTELADYVLDGVLIQPHEVNGNVIKMFKYSSTFYHSSYYERNPRTKRSASRGSPNQKRART